MKRVILCSDSTKERTVDELIEMGIIPPHHLGDNPVGNYFMSFNVINDEIYQLNPDFFDKTVGAVTLRRDRSGRYIGNAGVFYNSVDIKLIKTSPKWTLERCEAELEDLILEYYNEKARKQEQRRLDEEEYMKRTGTSKRTLPKPYIIREIKQQLGITPKDRTECSPRYYRDSMPEMSDSEYKDLAYRFAEIIENINEKYNINILFYTPYSSNWEFADSTDPDDEFWFSTSECNHYIYV